MSENEPETTPRLAESFRTPDRCEVHGLYEGQPVEGIYRTTCPFCEAIHREARPAERGVWSAQYDPPPPGALEWPLPDLKEANADDVEWQPSGAGEAMPLQLQRQADWLPAALKAAVQLGQNWPPLITTPMSAVVTHCREEVRIRDAWLAEFFERWEPLMDMNAYLLRRNEELEGHPDLGKCDVCGYRAQYVWSGVHVCGLGCYKQKQAEWQEERKAGRR